MTLVLGAPPPKKQSFGQKLGVGVGRGLEMANQLYQQHQNKQAMKELGLPENVSPDLAKAILVQKMKGQQKEELYQQKQGFLNEILGGKNKPSQGQFQQDMASSEMQDNAFNPLDISDADIARTAAVDPNLGRELRYAKDSALEQQRYEEGKKRELDKENRKYQFEREKLARGEETEVSKPILMEMNEIRKNIPLQEQAIADIQEATPNVSALDYFADVTGFEPARSAEGAKLKTAIKDFFLSDLSRAGARPNQWIEQQLLDALPKIGRSPEANKVTAEGMKFKVDLAKKRLEIIDRLADEDREKHTFVKGDIDSRAYKEMKKYVVDRQKQLKDNIKKIKAQYKGGKNTVKMISPEGSIYEVLSEDIDEAIKHDFEFSK